MPRFGTVLFDLDGTLVDTVALIRASHRYAVTTVLGYDLPDEVLLANVGRPLREQMEAFSRDRADDLMTTQREWNHAHTDDLIRPYPGVDVMLGRLRAAGCRIGVVTAKSRPTVELAYAALPQIAGYLDGTIACEDTTAHKPDPDPVVAALRLLGGQADDACYVGDSPFDIAAGRAAGVMAIGVTWGFFDREVLEAVGADEVVDTLACLEDLLMGNDG